jgi:CubicO group peptidase (beta-lactamase class C family)
MPHLSSRFVLGRSIWFVVLGGLAAPSLGIACGSTANSAGPVVRPEASIPGDAPTPDTGADAGDPRISQLLATATQEVQASGVVGTGLALVVDGKLAYAGGIGARSLGGPSVDGDTLFLAASTTKMLTAATVLSLAQEAKLDLETPLITYLPHLAVEAPFDVRAMTLSRLLSHTDGLADSNAAECSLPRFSDYGASGPVTLWGVPGTFFDYSNNDAILAAQAIESVPGAGQYEQAVQERVFARAAMSSATFDAQSASQSEDVATGYSMDMTGALTQPVSIAETVAQCPVLEPAAGAVLSARDFGKFVETMLAGGGSMLTPASVTRMETGILQTGENPNWEETYGYGLFVDQVGGETIVQHSGDLSPFHSAVLFVPAARFGFVMLINSDAPQVLEDVEKVALDLFAPPPMTPAKVIKTQPSAWVAYEGSYWDPYGQLGAFSLALQDASLVATSLDGGLVGNAVQVNGDYWTLSSNHALAGVFWRDDAGVVTEVVTRNGVANRLGVLDAGAGD